MRAISEIIDIAYYIFIKRLLFFSILLVSGFLIIRIINGEDIISIFNTFILAISISFAMAFLTSVLFYTAHTKFFTVYDDNIKVKIKRCF